MTHLEKFVARIDKFIERHNIAPTNFGVMAVNDSNFILDMRRGIRSPTIKTIDRVESFMNNYRKGRTNA